MRSLLLAVLLATTAPAVPAPDTVTLVAKPSNPSSIVDAGDGSVIVSTMTGLERITPDGARLAISDTANVRELTVDPTTGDLWYRQYFHLVHRRGDAVEVVMGENQTTRCDPNASCGDGGDATDAQLVEFSGPMAAGADGSIYFVDGRRVRRIDPGGTIDTVTSAPTYFPVDVDIGPDGEMAVASGEAVWERTNGDWVRLAGDPADQCSDRADPCGDGGPASLARVGVLAIEYDDAGRLFLTGEERIRVIDLDGRIQHVAGSWTLSFLQCGQLDACGTAQPAQLLAFAPNAAAAVGDDLIVTDRLGGGRLLRITRPMHAPRIGHQGYRMIASGGVFTFGWSPFHGSTGNLQLVSPIVAGRSNGADGYWFVAGDGGVFTFGDAQFFGSAAGATTSPVVDIVVRRDGRGYAVLERNGRVHSFGVATPVAVGDFPPYAAIVQGVSVGGERFTVVGEQPNPLPPLNRPVVAAHATRSGEGIWYVASDGGVFTMGDAGFFGSTGNLRLNQPVLDLIPTPTERGYWLIAADGGVFSFGDAEFMGSMGAVHLNAPVVAGVAGPVTSG